MGWGDKEQVLRRVELALEDRPYLLGDMFSTADVLVGSQINWGMMVGQVKGRPVLDRYVERLRARPALQKVTARDQELARQQGRG